MTNSTPTALRIISGLLLGVLCQGAFAQSPASSGDTGKDLFKTKCALCHASGGEGSGMGKQIGVKDLRADDVQRLSDAALTAIIVKGNGNMPAFKDQISKDDLAKIVAFMRTLKQ